MIVSLHITLYATPMTKPPGPSQNDINIWLTRYEGFVFNSQKKNYQMF